MKQLIDKLRKDYNEARLNRDKAEKGFNNDGNEVDERGFQYWLGKAEGLATAVMLIDDLIIKGE